MPYNYNLYECDYCHKELPWWAFGSAVDELMKRFELIACHDCVKKGRDIPKKHEFFYIQRKLDHLIYIVMNDNKMSNLRAKLFTTLDKVLSKEITPQAAKSVCEISQTIINSVKVEVEYLKAIGAKTSSGFMQIEEAEKTN